MCDYYSISVMIIGWAWWTFSLSQKPDKGSYFMFLLTMSPIKHFLSCYYWEAICWIKILQTFYPSESELTRFNPINSGFFCTGCSAYWCYRACVRAHSQLMRHWEVELIIRERKENVTKVVKHCFIRAVKCALFCNRHCNNSQGDRSKGWSS